MILSQFQAVGSELFARGLVSSNSGNLSIRMGDNITITRRGCMLNSLQEHDLIETGISKNSRATPLASIELAVHRAIYKETMALAIVHAHPPHYLEDKVPVLGWNMEVKPGGLADIIAAELKQRRIVIVRGHGGFAIGQLLDEAYNLTTALEECCQVICLSRSLQVSPAEE